MNEASIEYPVDRMPLRQRIGRLVSSGDWMARILIESALIVVSILSALAVNEWHAARADRELAAEALSAFRREIAQNRARLSDAVPYRLGLRDVLVRMNDDGSLATADHFHHMVGVEPLRPPFVTSTVWETSLTTGAIPHIDFEIVNALSLTYSLQERLGELSRSSMPALARGGTVAPAEMPAAVREVVAYLGDLSRSEAELLAAYDEVLRMLDEELAAGDAPAAAPLARAGMGAEPTRQ